MKNSSQARLGEVGGIVSVYPEPIALGAGEGLGDQLHAQSLAGAIIFQGNPKTRFQAWHAQKEIRPSIFTTH